MRTDISTGDELLFGLWQRAQSTTAKTTAPVAEDMWHLQIMHLEQLGRGMEETMRYLYAERPSFPQFVTWAKANETTPGEEEPLKEDVLTKEDLDFWEANGYVVVRNAVTTQQAADAAQAIWNHLGASPSDPATWYKTHEDMRGLMLTFYHHPALEANRRSPKVRKAYEQLYGTTGIHRNLDKVSFNPPERRGYNFMGSPLHWDVSLQLPIPFRLQACYTSPIPMPAMVLFIVCPVFTILLANG